MTLDLPKPNKKSLKERWVDQVASAMIEETTTEAMMMASNVKTEMAAREAMVKTDIKMIAVRAAVATINLDANSAKMVRIDAMEATKVVTIVIVAIVANAAATTIEIMTEMVVTAKIEVDIIKIEIGTIIVNSQPTRGLTRMPLILNQITDCTIRTTLNSSASQSMKRKHHSISRSIYSKEPSVVKAKSHVHLLTNARKRLK